MSQCEFIECLNKAKYGFPNEKLKFCKLHKIKDMKYIYGMKFCRCGKQLSFGFSGDERATCCKDCKKDGMIDIINKKCPCGKQAYFGLPGDKRPSCCKDCKRDRMIDIKNKKCKCGKGPYFGFPGDKRATCCKDCKRNGMIDIRNKKCPCGKQASFGFPGDKRPTCCIECKKEEMEDIRNKKCKANKCGFICPTLANPYYDGYCTHCFGHIFPNHPKTANIHKNYKELKVVNYISSKYERFYHDKPLYVNLNGGCCPSKRRIDLRKLIGNTLLCIEIDERQHRGYYQIDEENRYNDLFMDFSGKYIFIRYNPDKFKDAKGNKRNPQFETRMEVLEKEIRKHMLRIEQEDNKELLEIHHLFFDSI